MTRIKWTKEDFLAKLNNAIFELERPAKTPEQILEEQLGQPGGIPAGAGGLEQPLPTETPPIPTSLPPM